MFGDRYFGARYFGNRYFGPGAAAVPVADFDGHDGKPSVDSSPDAWDAHRQQRASLRETIAKAKRKANGEVEPGPIEDPIDEPAAPPVLSNPDHAAMIAGLMASAQPQQVAAPAPADRDDDELMAVLFLAA